MITMVTKSRVLFSALEDICNAARAASTGMAIKATTVFILRFPSEIRWESSPADHQLRHLRGCDRPIHRSNIRLQPSSTSRRITTSRGSHATTFPDSCRSSPHAERRPPGRHHPGAELRAVRGDRPAYGSLHQPDRGQGGGLCGERFVRGMGAQPPAAEKQKRQAALDQANGGLSQRSHPCSVARLDGRRRGLCRRTDRGRGHPDRGRRRSARHGGVLGHLRRGSAQPPQPRPDRPRGCAGIFPARKGGLS
jgi:hypothetical protein